mmetsp:Transcript_33529/g.99820  ORF Transcript_33529/g.99820 Transcript_33529/m.99820 type:complete len:207 (+) Transcript_33529:1291-1911(+)
MRPSSSVPTSPSTSTSMWPHCRSCDFSASVTTLCSMLAATSFRRSCPEPLAAAATATRRTDTCHFRADTRHCRAIGTAEAARGEHASRGSVGGDMAAPRRCPCTCGLPASLPMPEAVAARRCCRCACSVHEPMPHCPTAFICCRCACNLPGPLLPLLPRQPQPGAGRMATVTATCVLAHRRTATGISAWPLQGLRASPLRRRRRIG